MSEAVLLDQAAQNLRGLLARMSLGESLTLADEAGQPVALLVSLQTEAPGQAAAHESQSQAWLTQWQEIAQAIGKDWPIGRSAAEVLAEMRR